MMLRKPDLQFSIIKINGRKKWQLSSDEVFQMPQEATHAHIRAGEICFGVAKNNSHPDTVKTNRGTFFQRPSEAETVCFPGFCKTEAGEFEYGSPSWHP
jgi:hypothetical protein